MADQFLTLEHSSEGYYMDRGSKFLAFAFPVDNESAASGLIQKIKKENPKARHYCTALRLFPDASLERANDDGEPSGTAGRPIMGQLVKNNLTNVMIVVVRYFGGTKLGIPGLIEAYKTSAANAIESGKIIERKVLSKVYLKMSYDAFPHFLNFCKQNNIPVFEESFAEQASIVIGFPTSTCKVELRKALQQFSQMDFELLDQYKTYLDTEIGFLEGQVIV